MAAFKLRFQAKAIRDWASRYPVEYDAEIENIIAPQVKVRGYFLREEFIRLCHWKTPRSPEKQATANAGWKVETISLAGKSVRFTRMK